MQPSMQANLGRRHLVLEVAEQLAQRPLVVDPGEPTTQTSAWCLTKKNDGTWNPYDCGMVFLTTASRG